MTEAVFDFAAINRRLNRKPEMALAVPREQMMVWSDYEMRMVPARERMSCACGLISEGSCPVCLSVATERAPNQAAQMAVLRAELEQMEREVLRLDEVLTRACPR